MIEIEAIELLLTLVALVGFVWAPKTWTPGELVTASAMNTNIRDHLNESLRTQTTTLTGTQNNFALDGPFAWLKCTNASALTFTGVLLDGGNIDGARVILEAADSTVTLRHQDTGSATANRFITPTASDLVITVTERVLIVYDGASSIWRANRADAAQLLQATDDIVIIENIQGTRARVFNSADISINNTTFAALTFDSERFDSSDFHSTSVNTSRLTIPVAGHYLVGGQIAFESDTTGERLVEIREGGSIIHARVFVPANTGGGATELVVSTLLFLPAANWLELVVWQSSGGALDVDQLGNRSPEFWIHRVD